MTFNVDEGDDVLERQREFFDEHYSDPFDCTEATLEVVDSFSGDTESFVIEDVDTGRGDDVHTFVYERDPPDHTGDFEWLDSEGTVYETADPWWEDDD